MKVYVLETGSYESSAVFGVYATPEQAMAAHSPPKPTKQGLGPVRGSYVWQEQSGGIDELRCWEFDAEWEDFGMIHEYEVKPATHDWRALEKRR